MKFIFVIIIFCAMLCRGQVPHPMSSGTYLETFSDISSSANWPNGMGVASSAEWKGLPASTSGTIPDGVRITTATTSFVSGSTGGVQRGNGGLVLLAAGASDHTRSAAVELLLDFSGVDAGMLSFDWSTLNNGSGNRRSSLRVYTSVDGITYQSLEAASVLNFANGSPSAGAVSQVVLPSVFNRSPSARIRFYIYNGTGGTTGSRPKLLLDNIRVTAYSDIASTGVGLIPGTPLTITFDHTVEGCNNASFGGRGMVSLPGAGMLDSDSWRITLSGEESSGFGGAYTDGFYAAGTSAGDAPAAGVYAFAVSPGNHALGWKSAAGSSNEGTATLVLSNLSDTTIDTLRFSFLLYSNNCNGSSMQVSPGYSLNGRSFVPIPGMDLWSPKTAESSPEWERSFAGGWIAGLDWKKGSLLYFRWIFSNASGGNSDDLAIDDICFSSGNFQPAVRGSFLKIVSAGTLLLDSATNVSDTISILQGGVFEIGEGYGLTVGGPIINNGNIIMGEGAALVPGDHFVQQGMGSYEVIRTKPTGQPRHFYNFWSSPVAEGHTEMLSGGYDIYKFRPGGNTTGDYYSYSGDLTAGEGVAARGVEKAIFRGEVNNGTITVPIHKNPEGEAFNLVGNPYPSAISARLFIEENGPGILSSSAVYLWSQHNSFSLSQDDFLAVGVLGTPDYQHTTDLNSTFIASCQGFFIEAAANTALVFNNSMRSSPNTGFKSGQAGRLWLRLSSDSGYVSTLFGITEDATFDKDFRYDVRSQEASSFCINSLIDGVPHCIQGIPFLDEMVSIPLQVKTAQPGTYIIDIPRKEDFDGPVWLWDKKHEVAHDLSSPYHFITERANISHDDRFYIKRQSPENGAGEMATQALVCRDGRITYPGGERPLRVTVYDLRGALLETQVPGLADGEMLLKSRGQLIICMEYPKKSRRFFTINEEP